MPGRRPRRPGRSGGRWIAVAAAATVVLAGCSDDESADPSALCGALAQGRARFADTFEGFDPTDVDDALQQLRAARVELGELHDVAPGEVRDDLSTEIDYLQALIEALEGIDPLDPAAAVQAVREATEEHPDVQEAADRLEGWAESSC